MGTGSGSVSIEFARLGCDVTAVEKDKDNFDVVFFGGTDNLEKSFDNVFKHLKTGGRVIIAAV